MKGLGVLLVFFLPILGLSWRPFGGLGAAFGAILGSIDQRRVRPLHRRRRRRRRPSSDLSRRACPPGGGRGPSGASRRGRPPPPPNSGRLRIFNRCDLIGDAQDIFAPPRSISYYRRRLRRINAAPCLFGNAYAAETVARAWPSNRTMDSPSGFGKFSGHTRGRMFTIRTRKRMATRMATAERGCVGNEAGASVARWATLSGSFAPQGYVARLPFGPSVDTVRPMRRLGYSCAARVYCRISARS